MVVICMYVLYMHFLLGSGQHYPSGGLDQHRHRGNHLNNGRGGEGAGLLRHQRIRRRPEQGQELVLRGRGEGVCESIHIRGAGPRSRERHVRHQSCLSLYTPLSSVCKHTFFPYLSMYLQHLSTYIHTHTHTYMHTYTHTHTHTYIQTYTYTHMHTYTHTYIHTYIHTHTYTYTHIHIRTHTHTHTYIHAYIHIYIHTYIQYIYTYIHPHTHKYTYMHQRSNLQFPSNPITVHTHTYIHTYTLPPLTIFSFQLRPTLQLTNEQRTHLRKCLQTMTMILIQHSDSDKEVIPIIDFIATCSDNIVLNVVADMLMRRQLSENRHTCSQMRC